MARSSAGVPAAGTAKLKTSVCQPPATVVVASVSADWLLSAAFSTFNRTGMPASGDQTRSSSVLALAVNGRALIDWLAPVDNVVPAQTSAPAAFSTRTTLPGTPSGSLTMAESSAPPKPVSSGGGISSNVIAL